MVIIYFQYFHKKGKPKEIHACKMNCVSMVTTCISYKEEGTNLHEVYMTLIYKEKINFGNTLKK